MRMSSNLFRPVFEAVVDLFTEDASTQPELRVQLAGNHQRSSVRRRSAASQRKTIVRPGSLKQNASWVVIRRQKQYLLL
jgi:hypothetical protein